MRIHKFSTVDAFVAIDLDDAERSVGIVRRARKILQGGAKDLARSQTYAFAAHELEYGGASAGINGIGEGSEDAPSAFAAEAADLVATGTFLPDPGKGMTEADLAPLRAADPRNTAADQAVLTAASVAGSLEAALGVLDGRTIAIEGFENGGAEVAKAVVGRGAKVTAVATSAGMVANTYGLDVNAMADAFGRMGPGFIDEFGDVKTAHFIAGAETDGLTYASKMGALNHQAAGFVKAKAVATAAPMVMTAKALAVLRRADVLALPDFVTTAGPIVGWEAAGGTPADALTAQAAAAAGAIIDEVRDHPDGPLLGACYKAEAFLGTWQEQLPFGRPLAP
ncbi:MAG: hypothetical protein HKN26_12155 [Acidimicrobiales bacterium]|nr:hypothetical protein [Acidimicrobiales bacterium]